MINRLDIETAISLMSSTRKEDIERLNIAYGNYKIAKKNMDPFMGDVKSGLANINKIFEDAGMETPFITSYDDVEKDLKNKMLNIKALEAERDKARASYISIEEETKKYPGLTYGEVRERQEKARITWDDYNKKVSDAWYDYRQAEAKKNTLKKDEFNAKFNSYEYLQELVSSKKESILNAYVTDERTTNLVKKELFGLEIALDSLKSKQGVMADSIKVFKEISERLGIELVYDNEQIVGLELSAEKENVKKESVEQPVPEAQEEKQEEVKITNVFELAKALRTLNSGVEIRCADPAFSSTADSQIYCSVAGDKLKLPAGFEYNEKNGITNKHKVASYLAIKVADLKSLSPAERFSLLSEEKEVVRSGEEKAEPVKGAETPKATPKEDKSKVPFGQRFKVTNQRFAKATPFIKSTLFMGAVAGLATTAWTLPVLAVGAGLGVGAQALYTKYVKNNGPRIAALEGSKFYEKPADATWMITAIHGAKNALINGWKELKSRKQTEVKKQEEEVEVLKNEAEKAAASALEAEEQFDDLYKEIEAKMGGR